MNPRIFTSADAYYCVLALAGRSPCSGITCYVATFRAVGEETWRGKVVAGCHAAEKAESAFEVGKSSIIL